MENESVIELLKYHRHDLMNHMQLISGYLSMNKTDKARDKIADMLEHYNQERKLMSLQANRFTLWLLQFNHIHANFRLTYYIQINQLSLQHYDHLLVAQCTFMINTLKTYGDATVLYEGLIKVKPSQDPFVVELHCSFDGQFNDVKQLLVTLQHNNEQVVMNAEETDNGIDCIIKIPL